MKSSLFALILSVLFAAPAAAGRGDRIVECIAKDGSIRFSQRKCGPGETEVVPEALPEEAPPIKKAAPGILRDLRGSAVLPRRGAWKVRNVATRFKWNEEKKRWQAKGRIGRSEKEAVANAVAAFMMTRDIDLKLNLADTEDAAYDLNDIWKHREEFVVYWAKDAKPGGLPSPYTIRNGANAGGCSIVVQNPDGSHAYGVDGRIEPGARIVGAALFMVEFSRRVKKAAPCKEAGVRYEVLHQLGHCLGLTHTTPSPSIMGGTCGEDFYPNDVRAFEELYATR